MPLALFTTFVPMGAGVFIALAVAFFTTKFDEAELKKIDKMTFIAFGFVVFGFIASLFHLTNPMNGFGIFSGLGTSSLSNEVVVGIVFVVIAAVYCVLAVMGKLAEGARKGFAAVVGTLAGIGGIAGMAGTVSGMSNAMFAGSDLVSAALPFIIIVAAIALVAACALIFVMTRGKNATVMSVIAVVCAFAGILCARFAFYAMELSVGLCF